MSAPPPRMPPPAPALAHLLEDRKVVVCVGSGGVGKTTTAAALALYGASVGKRTLVITIDPAKRLANSLGLDELAHRPQRIAPAILEEAGLSAAAPLDAMTLDLRSAWDDLISRTCEDPDLAARIVHNPLYLALSRDLPGAQEFIACEALYVLVEEGHYDLVVLDTPPTANALDFLDAPNRILDMMDSDAFKLFARKEPGVAARIGLRFLDGAAGAVHAALSKFTGSDFLDDMGRFLVLFRDMYEPIKQRTRGLQELLRSEQSRFIIVTSPNPAPMREAIDFHQLLESRGLPIGALVANRTMPPPPDEALALDAAATSELLRRAGVAEADAAALAAPLVEAVAQQLASATRDLETVGALASRLEDSVPVVVVPRLHGDVGDAKRLVQLLPWLVGEALPTPA